MIPNKTWTPFWELQQLREQHIDRERMARAEQAASYEEAADEGVEVDELGTDGEPFGFYFNPLVRYEFTR